MVHVDLKNLYKIEYVLLWAILSFKAGLLNAAGFLIVGSYVSHVTGFGTQIGLALGHDDYTFGLELLVVPITFIGGGILTSLVLDQKSTQKIPNYPVIQGLITSLIGVISLGFYLGVFELTELKSQSNTAILLIGLLCFVCGLKNGLTTWASHGKIRTTHITGLSTDIGLHLPKLFKPDDFISHLPEPKKVNFVRIATLVSFSLGSCISALLIPVIGYKIFYISFVISAMLLVVSVVHRKRTQIRIEGPRSAQLKLGGIYANSH